MSAFLHHIDLTVSNPPAAQPLYDAFLTHCGFTLKGSGEDWAGWGLDDKHYPCITLLKAQGRHVTRKHDRYAPGLHHLALRAPSRESVDALFAKLQAIGATILDAP